jgi:hypothetical protein
MQRSFRPSALVPPGFAVDSTACDDTGVRITVRHSSCVARCPTCGAETGRVHSRYRRRLARLTNPNTGVPHDRSASHGWS